MDSNRPKTQNLEEESKPEKRNRILPQNCMAAMASARVLRKGFRSEES